MLKTRIQILEQGNVISKEVAAYVNDVIDMMYEEVKNPDKAKAEMFTTHIAMATQRINDKQDIEELDNDTWEEVRNSENYGKAEAFYEKMIEKSPVGCPEGEKRFIILHLCNLFEE